VDPLQPGDPSDIGPFRLLGRLGEGGMGRVYLGVSPGGRKVAIKVVHPHYAADQEFRRRFAREVAAARLVGGFYAALVVDADPNAASPWMATAYISGPTLAAAVIQRGPFDEPGVRELGAALAEGLAAIHACGLIHRDLKPGNVILAEDGPRIIDFGIAKGTGTTTLTGSGAIIGTVQYMSPEQLNGQELTPASDVFALGMVLAHAATGYDPFRGQAIPALINHILNDPPDLSPLAGDLRGIIGSCLAKSATGRPGLSDLIARLRPPATLSAPPAPVVPATVPDVAPGPVAASAVPSASPAPAILSVPSVQGAPSVPSSPVPPGPSGASVARTVDVTAPPRQAAPGAASPGTHRGAEPPAGRHVRRRPAILAAAAIAGAIAIAVPGVLLLDNPPAGSGRSTGLHSPATRPTAKAATAAAATRPTAATRLASATLITTMTDPSGGYYIDAAAFAPDGLTVATGGGHGGGMDLWDTATRRLTASLVPPGVTNPIEQSVTGVAYAPGGAIAAAGDSNDSTTVWDTATRKRIATLTDPPLHQIIYSQEVMAVALAPGGRVLATGDLDGITYLWNIATRKVIATVGVPTPTGGVRVLAFSPDGRTLAIGDTFGGIDVWSTATRKTIATFRPPGGRTIGDLGFTDGDTLAITDDQGHAYLWNASSGKTVTLAAVPRASSYVSLAITAGGLVLATTDGEHRVYLWNTVTRRVIGVITDPNGRPDQEISALTLSPDGRILAAGDGFGSVSLWRVTYQGP
jgi:serine/threonine protein kinase/WD40 repeat protein